jgi:hypothetical protein
MLVNGTKTNLWTPKWLDFKDENNDEGWNRKEIDSAEPEKQE